MPIWPHSAKGRGALVAALLALQSVPALADRDPRSGAPLPPERKKKEIPSPITDRFYLEGIFYPLSVSTRVRLDPSHAVAGVTGTEVSAERDLGQLSRLYQGRMELMFRLRERSKLRVDFEDVSRSASHLLARTIQFGNETFLVNEQADTQLGWRIFTLTYTYALYRNDWLEVGTGIAAHMVEAQAHGAVLALGERQDVSASDAFPTLPIDLAWRMSERFSLTARAQYFRATVGNFSGSLGEYHTDIQYRCTPNFALGIGYTLERISVTLRSGTFPGIFATDNKGGEAFFRVSL
jgi:hypothetical protein